MNKKLQILMTIFICSSLAFSITSSALAQEEEFKDYFFEINLFAPDAYDANPEVYHTMRARISR